MAGELAIQARRLDGGRAPDGDGRTKSPDGRRSTRDDAAAARSTHRNHARAPVTRPVATPRGARLPALSKDAYRRQKAVIEGDLTRLGLRKSHLELALGDPATQSNYIELRRVSSELADVDAALAQAEEAWLVLEDRAPR